MRFSDRLLNFLKLLGEIISSYNATSVRIYATIFLAFLTSIRYLFLSGMFGEVVESTFQMWLIFLAVVGGLDVTQYTFKRKTHIPTNGTASSTDTKEIYARRTTSDHPGVEPS